MEGQAGSRERAVRGDCEQRPEEMDEARPT